MTELTVNGPLLEPYHQHEYFLPVYYETTLGEISDAIPSDCDQVVIAMLLEGSHVRFSFMGSEVEGEGFSGPLALLEAHGPAQVDVGDEDMADFSIGELSEMLEEQSDYLSAIGDDGPTMDEFLTGMVAFRARRRARNRNKID
ncbi:hypothetical protein [Aeromicrobium sp. 179-A 4D2 NHS]|uniref:hypothetical protein n=1 Tax=Aeromicrobium sp. 179-A 4D2 NHS TaxID=3142375 RepID=UPI00399F3AEB